MSTPNDVKPSSIDSAKKERLSLRRESVRTLGVRSGVQTGRPNDGDTGGSILSCRTIVTSNGCGNTCGGSCVY